MLPGHASRNVHVGLAKTAAAVGREVQRLCVGRETQGEVAGGRVIDRRAEVHGLRPRGVPVRTSRNKQVALASAFRCEEQLRFVSGDGRTAVEHRAVHDRPQTLPGSEFAARVCCALVRLGSRRTERKEVGNTQRCDDCAPASLPRPGPGKPAYPDGLRKPNGANPYDFHLLIESAGVARE